MSFLTANESQRKRGNHHTSFQINFRVSSTNFRHRHWCNSDHISKLDTTFRWQQVSKQKWIIEARGLETSMKNTMPFSEIGTSAKILRWLTPSEGGLLDSLALAWNLWKTWIPVCCFFSSRYGISSYCGFPLLQPVIALEFFQHRILRSKYLNFFRRILHRFHFGHFRKVSEVTASCRGLVWIMGQEKLLTWSVSEGGEITVVTCVLFRFILSSWTQNIRILHCQDVFPLQIGGNDTGPTFPTGWSGLFLCQRTWRAGKSKH